MGKVTAAMAEASFDNLALVSDLKKMAEIGPIERIFCQEGTVTIGRCLTCEIFRR